MKSGIFPVDNYWLSCDYKEYSDHLGIDVGFNSTYGAKVPVWAWRDGVVVYNSSDKSRGYYITLRHDYGNEHQYTQYLHLDAPSTLKIGSKVKQGQEIGIRGGSFGYGVHLHFCMTKCTTENWNVSQIAKNGIDPKPYLYRGSKDYHLKCDINPEPKKVSNTKARRDLAWLPDTPYPETVERNEKVRQFEVLQALHWRKSASKDEAYFYNVEKGIYNVQELIKENDRIWVKVDDTHFFCGWEKEQCYGKFYDVEDEKDKKIKELEKENAQLKKKIDSAIKVLNNKS